MRSAKVYEIILPKTFSLIMRSVTKSDRFTGSFPVVGKGRFNVSFTCTVTIPETLARIRTEYLVPLHSKIASRLEQIEIEKRGEPATTALKRLDRERDLLIRQAEELRVYDEKLRHYPIPRGTETRLDQSSGPRCDRFDG